MLHVTGKAKFDDNIITDKMLQANSVTADKIKTDSLSALSANLGDVHSGTITSTTIKNDSNTFSVDPEGNIRGANIVASTISADSIFNAGFKVKNIDYAILTVAHGQDVPPIGNYSVNECIFVPIGYNFTEKHLRNDSTSSGRREWDKQYKRMIGSCTVCLQGNQPNNNDNGFIVGLNGRKAVCQSKHAIRYTGGGNNGNDLTNNFLAFGVLYVLVIGKKG